MATLASAAPSGLSFLAAPLRALIEAFDLLHAAQRAAHEANTLYHSSDAALSARGLTRDAVSAHILRTLETR